MTLALWLVQGLLAGVFGWSAYCKGVWDRDRLVASGQTGVRGLSVPAIRFIASAELLGVLGLLLPGITGIAPFLTPLAAAGLAVIMVLAGIVHTRLHEPKNVLANVVLFLACAFVAVGRGRSLP